MANLKSIKSKIVSYKKTGTVTHAMEAVSAVKMRKSQERAISSRPYARAGLRVLAGISGSTNVARHPLMHVPATGRVVVVIITSDKGLAGALNSAIIRETEKFITNENLSREDLIFLCLGKRGYEFALHSGYEVVHHHTNISDAIDEGEFRAITDQVIALYRAGGVREVRVAYTNFRSIFEQHPAVHKVLPLLRHAVEHMVEDIVPVRGKYADVGNGNGAAVYTIEPDADEVLAALVPRLVNIAIFHKMLESKASEHSARMVAMKNATDKAKEMAHSLTRTFNKVRQAAITREVSEITSGIEAMK
ncbi:ATP synthase F1 subunit gamma [Candidatus Kaiserbacteria bacterium RIFCSPHIGHO2_01_FULL_55_17]|uniref:ATP synthase gamma chain n=1 Tax=Candidatus Kaiserbacteria bacterium RIFCSPHIGHO2_01_FULL_55_17 TaxID=1798484 RepID=A0A1F6D7H1_9BACT|nr:MAG: ATP synthase F1 subunit gamma [Candidatus Kaiserbacteria bacterium RIFCSPHIGHO2_01_FULL_55_17]